MYWKRFNNCYLCWSIVLLSFVRSVSPANNATSSTLHAYLFTDYKTQLLPVCASGASYVNITLDLALRQIINLNEKDQVLTTNVWVRMGWTDCRLTWNSSEYGGVSELRMPYEDVWVPDLALYDSSAEDETMPGHTDYRAQITADGKVQYNFPTVLKSICRVTVTYFPFDTQSCGLRFGSWSHSQKDLDFHPIASTGDLNEFIKNNEWAVSDLIVERRVKQYSSEEYPYIDINYSIIMIRRSDFYVMTMMFPCILVSVVAAVGFLLPSESGEKVSLEVTVLLSQAVFLLVISDFLPPSAEEFPVLGTYFATSMLLVSMSLIMSVLVLNVHHRGDVRGKTVPPWVRRFFLNKLGQCCTTIPNYDVHKQSFKRTDASSNHDGSISQSNCTEETNVDKEDRHSGSNHKASFDRPMSFGQFEQLQNSHRDLPADEQNESLYKIDKHFVRIDDTEQDREDWHKLARILDRIFLSLYVLCFIVLTLTFVLQLIVHNDDKP